MSKSTCTCAKGRWSPRCPVHGRSQEEVKPDWKPTSKKKGKK